MLKAANKTLLIISILLFFTSEICAQDKKPADTPPANVVVSEVSTGIMAPESEFVGTVYYQQVSDIASEVEGVVEAAGFEEGQRVKKGDVLVRLDSDLLEKRLQATRASYEQALSELEKAELEFKRADSLYKEGLISEQAYDERRFNVQGIGKKSLSLKAETERIEVELRKKVVTAPFDGIVVKKHVDRGEWISPGATAATIARDDELDIVVEVPERVIKFITTGTDVRVKAGGGEIKGKVFAVIPSGDIATRTIPVKIRAKNSLSLMEGMEARVSLPAGEKKKTFIVHRDAVVNVFGMNAVFAVIDSEAKMIPVEVVGYRGLEAGISAQGLAEGMKVVIKGNERLRDGQPVLITDDRRKKNAD